MELKFEVILTFTAMFFAFADAQKKIFCYWTTELEASQIDPMVCTHIAYSFIGVDSYGEINYLDRSSSEVEGHLRSIVKFKSPNPILKVLISVGGPSTFLNNEWSNLAANPSSREDFAQNVLVFLEKNQLDGIDIDWEYPNIDGKSPQDIENFVLLLNTLRQTLTDYILTTALGVLPERTELSYNIPAIFDTTDYVILKSYDLRGIGDTVTGQHSVLYSSPIDVNNCVTSLSKYGIANSKILLGIPMYGYAFALEDPSKHGIGAPATFIGPLKYYEICPKVKAGILKSEYDGGSRETHAYNDNEWIGFEDTKSAKEKANFIYNTLLAGAMIRSLDSDDYSNICGDGTFPLISIIYKTMNSRIPLPVTEPPGPSTHPVLTDLPIDETTNPTFSIITNPPNAASTMPPSTFSTSAPNTEIFNTTTDAQSYTQSPNISTNITSISILKCLLLLVCTLIIVM